MIFRVNSITIETRYDSTHNVWYSRAYDSLNCYFKNRRLRQGVYPFFNGIQASVDYLGKNPFDASGQSTGDCIDDAVIRFTTPCLIVNNTAVPCG